MARGARPPRARVRGHQNARAIGARIEALIDSGRAGIFHTSSEMQPRNKDYSAEVFRTMYRECRERRRLCYAEGRTLAANAYSQFPLTAPPSPEQWFYWRVLSDLHLGISRLAINRIDLLRADADGFDTARTFASTYLGAHLRPAESPGAWVAFRQGDYGQGDYTLLARARGCGQRVFNVGPTQHPYGLWATRLGPNDACRVDLDPTLAGALADEPLTLEVIVMRHGDATAPAMLMARVGDRRAQAVALDARLGWQTLKISIDGIGNDNASITLDAKDGSVLLHRVEVRRAALKAP
ncbi:MAG: hypothetical protein AAFX85_08675, partial [Pseudomonadota bacterium]